MPEAQPPRVHAVSTELDELGSALDYAEAVDPLVWQRTDDVLIGVGDALRLSFDGPNRFRDAAAAWEQLSATAIVRDGVAVPGSGLIAFGAFTFADTSAQSSVLRIPKTVFGRRAGRAFRTDIRLGAEPFPRPVERHPIGSLGPVNWEPSRDAQAHQAAVRQVLRLIQSGSVEKVVLARATTGHLPGGGDLRAALTRLGEANPEAWVFAIDGLLGASPETLLALRNGRASIRVLAGTRDRTTGSAAHLLESPKDATEHEIAVESVVSALERAGVSDVVRGTPFALELPELWHLASDISFHTEPGSVLRLIEALHPTGAVAGSPTAAALRIIESTESIDRGRYAGPIGWLDAAGNGEWAIALRCAHIAGDVVTAWAGGGIVLGSDPALEYAETELKLRTIRSAL